MTFTVPRSEASKVPGLLDIAMKRRLRAQVRNAFTHTLTHMHTVRRIDNHSNTSYADSFLFAALDHGPARYEHVIEFLQRYIGNAYPQCRPELTRSRFLITH